MSGRTWPGGEPMICGACGRAIGTSDYVIIGVPGAPPALCWRCSGEEARAAAHLKAHRERVLGRVETA